jgi:hypothetical protein
MMCPVRRPRPEPLSAFAGSPLALRVFLVYLVGLIGLPVAVTGCGGGVGGPKVGEQTTTPSSPSPAPSAVASPVRPRGGTYAPHPVQFTGVTQLRGGRELKITWWSGVEPCHVLDRVAVAETSETVRITLFEGRDPRRRNQPCVLLAVRKQTVVTLRTSLDQRKIIDGAGR